MIRYNPYTDSFIDNSTEKITPTINLNAIPKDTIQINEVMEISDESIEKIANAVIRKLADCKDKPLNCLKCAKRGKCEQGRTDGCPLRKRG